MVDHSSQSVVSGKSREWLERRGLRERVPKRKGASSEFLLVAIPLFIMLGEILLRSGMAER
uniref:hypothetical protein n=1 Tax=Alcaligenes nematophilus TaxID=2994643 RepID=UPI00384F626D